MNEGPKQRKRKFLNLIMDESHPVLEFVSDFGPPRSLQLALAADEC